MTDVRSLVWHLRDRHERGEVPDAHAADAKLWFLALGELVRQGALELAARSAGPLRAAFPASGMIATLALLLETMPPPSSDRGFATFADRGEAVQAVRRDRARTLVLAFCGRHGNLGMPLPIAHRWFGLLDVSVAYVRDPAGELYIDGIPALAPDRRGTLAALQALCRHHGAERLLCYGNSTGAYAALHYGLDLGAAAVLALNTVAVFPPERTALRRQAANGERQHEPAALAPLYSSAPCRPRAHLVVSAGNQADVASAATMAGVERVTIEAVPDHAGHDAQVALVARGRFGPLLFDFADEWRGAAPAASPP